MARGRSSYRRNTRAAPVNEQPEPFFAPTRTAGGRKASTPFFQAKTLSDSSAPEAREAGPANDAAADAPGTATADPKAASPTPGNPKLAGQQGSRFIVDDGSPADGTQLHRTEFLSLLRDETYKSVSEVLVGSPFASGVSGYMQSAVASYGAKSAAQLETSLLQQVPAAAGAQSAMQLIGMVRDKVVSEVRSRVPALGVAQSVGQAVSQTVNDVAQGVNNVVSGAGSALGKAFSDAADILFKENTGGAHSTASPATVMQQLGKGQSIDSAMQSRMETAYGTSFSDVEVHTDANAAQLSGNMNARAFTVGNHIAFGQGEHQPGSLVGDALMAHELAHVMQQREGAGTHSDYNSLENEADNAAAAVVMGGESDGTVETRGRTKSRSGLQIQRCGSSSSSAPAGTKDAGVPSAVPADGGTPATPAVPEAAPQRPKDMKLEYAGANRTEWRVQFGKEKEAKGIVAGVRQLGIKADDPEPKGKLWTFFYYPLTEDEAKAIAEKEQKRLGDKYRVEVKNDKNAKTFYLKVSLKCPEAVPAKAGFDVWPTCFAKEKEAKEQAKKFDDASIPSEVFQLDEEMFAVYYKPYKDEKSATDAATAKNKSRGGNTEGMFKVTSKWNEKLKSFVPTTTTTCPDGYEEIGRDFRLTTYVLAQEKDFPEKPVTEITIGGKKATFRTGFLFETKKSPLGVKMEGSGVSLSGKFIHYAGNNTFEETATPLNSRGRPAVSGQTVAVDPDVIKLGTELLIEDVGPRVAEDVGGAINGHHIDIYHGTDMDWRAALQNTLDNKMVCRKKPEKKKK